MRLCGPQRGPHLSASARKKRLRREKSAFGGQGGPYFAGRAGHIPRAKKGRGIFFSFQTIRVLTNQEGVAAGVFFLEF